MCWMWKINYLVTLGFACGGLCGSLLTLPLPGEEEGNESQMARQCREGSMPRAGSGTSVCFGGRSQGRGLDEFV